MSEVKLTAAKRTEFGKGAARRLRRAHQVPAVIYGHGTDPVHVSLPGHATMLALKQQNALIALDIEGASQLVLPKAVQRDPIKGVIEHVDLVIVRRGEKVTVDIAVHVTGEPAPGALVTVESQSLSIEVEATHIPQRIDVDIDGAAAGTLVHAGQVALPAGATLAGDPEAVVVHISSAAESLDTGGEGESETAAEAEPVGAEA